MQDFNDSVGTPFNLTDISFCFEERQRQRSLAKQVNGENSDIKRYSRVKRPTFQEAIKFAILPTEARDE